jgi:hypothetical protein
MATFTIDANIRGLGTFGVTAYIVGDRWRHDIVNDHFGDLSSLQVITEKWFGPYPPGTPLHYVLDWLVNRIVELESVEKGYGKLFLNAYILALGGSVESGGTVRGAFGIDGVKFQAVSGGGRQFYLDAELTMGFSMDAYIRFQGAIYVEAVVV